MRDLDDHPALVGRRRLKFGAGRMHLVMDGDGVPLSFQDAFDAKPVLDPLIDFLHQLAAGCHDKCALPGGGAEAQPAIGGDLADAVLHLDDMLAQRGERGSDLTTIGQLRGRQQGRIAGADILGHLRGGVAHALGYFERFAGLDGAELPPVADVDHLVDLEQVSEPLQLRRLQVREHGGFVDEDHAAPELIAGLIDPGLRDVRPQQVAMRRQKLRHGLRGHVRLFA